MIWQMAYHRRMWPHARYQTDAVNTPGMQQGYGRRQEAGSPRPRWRLVQDGTNVLEIARSRQSRVGSRHALGRLCWTALRRCGRAMATAALYSLWTEAWMIASPIVDDVVPTTEPGRSRPHLLHDADSARCVVSRS
jgi:hypothetical protein